jgi:ATP-dependent helicase HrpB
VRIVVDAGTRAPPALRSGDRHEPARDRAHLARVGRPASRRAGRTAPGVCYRLWSESAHASLLPQAPAGDPRGRSRAARARTRLLGTRDPGTLAWLDPPPAATLAQARDLLQRLEAIDATGRVTALGRDMAALGVHPRLAHMVLRARSLGLARLGCEIAAVLSERDPLRGGRRAGSGPAHAHRRAARPRCRPASRGSRRRCAASSASCSNSSGSSSGCDRSRPEDSGGQAEADAVGLLLAFAYPDRIGRARAERAGATC